MLDEYEKSYEQQHQLDCETRQRDSEIGELQKALSDMQVFLFKEREQVLKLYAENDGFKVNISWFVKTTATAFPFYYESSCKASVRCNSDSNHYYMVV